MTLPLCVNRRMKNTSPTHADKPHTQQLMAEIAREQNQQIVAVAKGRAGQPTKFTPELWENIIDRLACCENIVDICAEPGMPSYYTVRKWWRANPELRDQVEEAWRDASYFMHYVNDSLLSGGVMSNGDFRRDEARAANNRWFMSKANRRLFGEKVQHDIVTFQPVILDVGTIEGEGGDGV